MSLADRVQERLHALQLNPAETARRAGLARTFVADLLHGKKKTVRNDGLAALARALECDVDYLTGAQETPRKNRQQKREEAEIEICGICEAGVWRPIAAPMDPTRIPIAPDQRFSDVPHKAFLIRGSGANRIGIEDGMIVIGIEPRDDLSRSADLTGAPLVVRRVRPETGEVELSIRTIEATIRGAVLAAPSDQEIAPIRFPAAKGEPAVEIVAVILRAVRFFGSRA